MLKKICAVVAISATALLGSALPASAEDMVTTKAGGWSWWLAEETVGLTEQAGGWSWWLADQATGVADGTWDWLSELADDS
ncbi:hypothetical protein [Salinactinospora qingdaonensis]|uniref:Uncharacterized protein n=1 Tax=Salinactinospora qingdaonensis TaxID=702744 RepID=A0ABP7FMV7_9ACTN